MDISQVGQCFGKSLYREFESVSTDSPFWDSDPHIPTIAVSPSSVLWLFKSVRFQLFSLASPVSLMVKNLPANAGDPGSIPGLGGSPGEGNGYPLQYSCLENPMDRGAWRAAVPEGAESGTRLIDRHFHFIWIFVVPLGRRWSLPSTGPHGKVTQGPLLSSK